MKKFAIPMAQGALCMHFGHCEEFAFVEADETTGAVVNTTMLTPPPHAPGVIPRWIAAEGANVAIVGGMGAMAQQILAENGVEVIAGVSPDTPENLVKSYFAGTLTSGVNVCDHDHGHGHGHSCGSH